jgi:DNA-directed RNA polymerase specialized sigma24 family protein
LNFGAQKGVTKWTRARSGSVNEAVAERMPVISGTDTETFAALYERTFPRVYAYVASLLRDRAAAEDVTAQAFERAYRKRSSYRPRRGSKEAWLFGIARNAALDELRLKKHRPSSRPSRRTPPRARSRTMLRRCDCLMHG